MKTQPKLAVQNDITIEKGVPIPPIGRDSIAAYPFAKMEMNDSFLVGFKEGETDTQIRERVTAAMSYARRNNTNKYCSRKVEGGIRVWRIA